MISWARRSVAGVLVVVAAVNAWASLRPAPAAGAAPVPAVDALEPQQAPGPLVFVSGSVVRPGLYRLAAGARAADALAAAGGLAPGADRGRLPDLAAVVHDGHQLNVPAIGAGRSGTAALRVDVNSASVEELAGVPGMPAGLPEAIIAHRDQWGPVASLSQLAGDLALDRTLVAALSSGLTARAVHP